MHLAPPGSSACDYGISVSHEECETAALNFFPNPARSLYTGHGGTCCDISWGRVPLGCSIQSGGDGTAHYKTSGSACSGCIHEDYQLVCKSNGKCFRYPFNIIVRAHRNIIVCLKVVVNLILLAFIQLRLRLAMLS